MDQPHPTALDSDRSGYELVPLPRYPTLSPPSLRHQVRRKAARSKRNTGAFEPPALSTAELECSVCLDNVVPGEEIASLLCGHWFHSRCMEAWLKAQDTCPVCRGRIVRRNVSRRRVAPLTKTPLPEEEFTERDQQPASARTTRGVQQDVDPDAVEAPTESGRATPVETGAGIAEWNDPPPTWPRTAVIAGPNTSPTPPPNTPTRPQLAHTTSPRHPASEFTIEIDPSPRHPTPPRAIITAAPPNSPVLSSHLSVLEILEAQEEVHWAHERRWGPRRAGVVFLLIVVAMFAGMGVMIFGP